MSNNNKTPAIRFKGFTDTWEQRKLGEVADIVGGGTPSTSNDDYWDGDIDWYAPAEIADQIYVASSERKITQQGYDNSSAKMLPVGTVLFTSRAGIGKTAILRKEGCTNQGFQSIVPHINELDSYFIFSRSEEMKRYGETVGAGSTFVEVSGKQMANMELMMPITMEEQVTIGSFFSNLDFLITLHQRKCDKLIQFKAAMLQKMFPQNGADKPEIRFKGFTDAWEQRELEEVITVGNGMDYKHLSEGDIPVYGTGGYMLSVDKALSYDKDAIGIGRKGTIDKPYVLKAPFWTVDTLFYCIPKEDYSLDFVYCIFQNVNWKEKDESTGVPSLSKVNINSTDVKVPTLAEQEKIGAYFAQLDNLITLHQRKCDKYKWKKTLLLECFRNQQKLKISLVLD